MENLTLDQLKVLAQQASGIHVSMFLPTHPAGQDALQDPIRYKNLVRDAERQLLEGGMKPREASAFLEPAQALMEDTTFWQHQRDGLAVFIGEDDFHYYHLPFQVEELLVIAQSYYVKPVLPLFTNNGHFFILAVSQNAVRLFEATRHTISQMDLPEETPESIDEALQLDDPEKQLQFHTGTASASAGGGQRAGVFHGHGGGGGEEKKEELERYLNLLDTALKPVWREQQAPLVLAGVDYLLPIYQKVSEYAHIMPEGITGNPEQLRPEELHEQAWMIVEPHFLQELGNVVDAYQQLASTEQASENVEAIVAAAAYGRVDKLIVAVDAQIWGTFDTATGKVVQRPTDQRQADDLPLLDFAAMQTLQSGGTVYALTQDEMVSDSPAVAVFRY